MGQINLQIGSQVLAIVQRISITSTPVLTANVDAEYSYQPVVYGYEDIYELSYTLTTAPSGMTIDEDMGLITWTPDSGDVGNHSVTIKVTDLISSSIATQSYSITVTGQTNHAPTITSTPSSTTKSNVAWEYQAVGYDEDVGDTLTWSLTSGRDGMAMNASTGLLTWTPDSEDLGTWNITIRVTDPHAAYEEQTFPLTVTDTPQGLDEMLTRNGRRATATWASSYVENATTYIWQPETFMYHDVITEHEVWKLSNTPKLNTLYHSDIGISPWSADGSKIAFTAYNRVTQAYSTSQQTSFPYIWMTCHTNGNAMRPTKEAARRLGGGYFHWCPQIRNTWYEIGMSYFGSSADANTVYRSVLNEAGVVTSSTALVSIPTWTGAATASINKLISANGRKLVIQRSSSGSATNKFFPVTIASNGTASLDVANGYSFDRDLALYGAMTSADVRTFHDRYIAGTGTDFFGMPGSGWAVWWRFSMTGSAPDGGPLYTGDEWVVAITGKSGSFSASENLTFSGSGSTGVYVSDAGGELTFILTSNNNPAATNTITGVSSGATATLSSIISQHDFGEIWPENHGSVSTGNLNSPFVHVPVQEYNADGSSYWSHFTPDRWNRLALFANAADGLPIDRGGYYDDIGPGVWDYRNHEYIVPSHGGTGQHFAWNGFTDWNVASIGSIIGDGYKTQKLAVQKYDDPYSQITLNSLHTRYYNGTAYTTLARPGQSPDGTKASWHGEFLNGQNVTDIFWTVVYYPYPPTDLEAATGSVEEVAVSFLPPTYTDRRWIDPVTGLIDETNGEILYAREIKTYVLWRSANGTTSWSRVATGTATYDNNTTTNTLTPTYDGDWVSGSNLITIENSPGNGTWYYALTSREHSGLESTEFSEVLKVVVSGGVVTNTEITAAQGQTGFWTTSPTTPSDFVAAAGSASGHCTLTWSEPAGDYIRYYNIYYSTTGQPSITQAYRMASIPAGHAAYLDWLANTASATHYYAITSVDYQGNESDPAYDSVE